MARWNDYFDALISILRDKEAIDKTMLGIGRGTVMTVVGSMIGSACGGGVGGIVGASVGGFIAALWDKTPSIVDDLLKLANDVKERFVEAAQKLVGSISISALKTFVLIPEQLKRISDLAKTFCGDLCTTIS